MKRNVAFHTHLAFSTYSEETCSFRSPIIHVIIPGLSCHTGMRNMQTQTPQLIGTRFCSLSVMPQTHYESFQEIKLV